MSKIVYRTKKVQCNDCEEKQLLQESNLNNSRGNDPKLRRSEQEEWQNCLHCECGNALSAKSSRFGPRGYTVIDPFVDEVTADELEDKEPDFGTLFDN